MKFLIYISIYLISTLNGFSQDNCAIKFSSLGIRDFELLQSFKDVTNSVNDFVVEEQKENLLIINFSEIKLILGEEKIVEYSLTFIDNKLCRYTFRFKIEKSLQGLNYFKEIVKSIKDYEENDFLSGDRLSYTHRNNSCKKFFRTDNIMNSESAYGGISLTNL